MIALKEKFSFETRSFQIETAYFIASLIELFGGESSLDSLKFSTFAEFQKTLNCFKKLAASACLMKPFVKNSFHCQHWYRTQFWSVFSQMVKNCKVENMIIESITQAKIDLVWEQTIRWSHGKLFKNLSNHKNW